jgi:O-antigen ligase
MRLETTKVPSWGRYKASDSTPTQSHGSSARSRWHPVLWGLSIYLVLVQQGAFISVPLVVRGVSSAEMREIENPFNAAAIATSLMIVAVLSATDMRRIGALMGKHLSTVLFLALVLMSTIWSIHPDLTIRRGAGYVVTILVAANLAVRFDLIERLKILSWSFAISGTSSLIFAIVLPQYGVMQIADLAGAWQGVFPHKNMFGPVMAVALFTELALLVLCKGRSPWRIGLLALFFSLVVLSKSATALLLSLGYIAGTLLYLVWVRERTLAIVAGMMLVAFLLIGLIVFWNDPNFALGILGRDTSLTGRTELWPLVIRMIAQKSLLGWGYRAMWQPDDAPTVLVDEVVGWGAGSSHNAFLEIALQLGIVGLLLLLGIICAAFWRAFWCLRLGMPLGWFALMFFTGSVLAAQTMETLGQNQVIDWLVFNLLMFSCSIAIAGSNYRVSEMKYQERSRGVRPRTTAIS